MYSAGDTIQELRAPEMTVLSRHNTLATTLVLAGFLTLSGCGSWWLPRPHRIDIQQGNILSTEDVGQISAGMSKIEVINLIGKPITTSVFDDERWDYIYSQNRSGGTPNSKRFTVFFQNDVVFRVENDGYESTAEVAQ